MRVLASVLGYAQKHVEARRSEVDEATSGLMLSLSLSCF